MHTTTHLSLQKKKIILGEFCYPFGKFSTSVNDSINECYVFDLRCYPKVITKVDSEVNLVGDLLPDRYAW